MQHDFADGKYTVINDNGKLTALRHGEPWGRDLVGDNLVYWMLVEVDRLKANLRRLTMLARTSGGTAGPDPELMAACAAAEALLIGAQSTPQPADVRANQPLSES